MMFCPRCGQQASDDIAYCSRCGMVLQNKTAPGLQSAQESAAIVQVNQKLRSTVNFFSPKCPHCKIKGEMVYVGWERVKVEHGFGVVTRQETQQIRKRDSSGRSYTEQAVTSRQERVPVVRTTFRFHYRCEACQSKWTKETVDQAEDFSPPTAQPTTRENTMVYTREVVKVPCKYCQMLIDPVRDQKCPSCGANLSLR